MPHRRAIDASPRRLLVVAVAGLVHAAAMLPEVAAQAVRKGQPGKPAEQQPAARPKSSPDALTAPAIEMRDAILAAARSGDIEELRTPLQWNELPPDIADAKVADPIAYWRQTSADGAGREILAQLSLILELPHAVTLLGRDIENSRLFVWPGLAEKPLEGLTPSEVVQLMRLVPAAEAVRMIAAGRYTGWRLTIGADGTWHSFRRGP